MISFDKYGFNQSLLKSIKELNFNEPTSIQDDAIPNILSFEHDIIATAQTGTGKTAAFGLPIIELTNNSNKDIESVILCPTRELCLQISKDLNDYSKYMKHPKVVPIYGGTKIESQIKKLRNNPKIIVCTPGRLNDFIKRKKINLSAVKYFVLDEADEMLSMGFKTDIDKVLAQIPVGRKIYLFSATLSEKVKKVTKTYMKNPLMISTSIANEGAENVKHIYYVSKKSRRYDVIKNIIDMNKNIYTIVFCRTRRETKEIATKLIRGNYKAKVLNGDLSQSERDQVMKQFRTKKINILVATDVASRGIDVDSLTHIINYTLPDDDEVYVHRSGRTGRAGNQGLSIALVTTKEQRRLKDIEKLSKISFKKNEVPTQAEIFKSQMNSFIDTILNTPVPSEKDKDIFKNLYYELDAFTKEELIGKIISLNIKNSKTLKNSTDRIKERSNKENKINGRIKSINKDSDNPKQTMSKLTMNIGRSNKMDPETLIRLINKTVRSRNTEIGKINIKKNYTTFEVDSKMKNRVLSKMKNIRHNGKRILVLDYNPDTIEFQTKRKRKSLKRRR